MINILVTLLVIAIVGAAVVYIIREKKKGVKCIGCPSQGNCGHSCCDLEKELKEYQNNKQ